MIILILCRRVLKVFLESFFEIFFWKGLPVSENFKPLTGNLRFEKIFVITNLVFFLFYDNLLILSHFKLVGL